MTTDTHDTLVYRLAQILVKLNQGEKLDPAALADEFGVNIRTVQRDLNVRFGYLPLQKINGRYFLDPVFLGKLTTRDVERFACLAGVRGLFPSLSDEFLADIFDSRFQSALLVKGHSYEDLAGKEEMFRRLERAIVSRNHVSFDYERNKDGKNYTAVAPIKLINHKGIWYLAARDNDKIKTFYFARIESLTVSDTRFAHDADIVKQLEAEDGIWFGEEHKEVVFKVASDIACYFKRRKLIANQVIEKELEDGGLIISAKLGHANQVLPIVRYWIPHIRVISPEGLQAEMEKDLYRYLDRSGS